MKTVLKLYKQFKTEPEFRTFIRLCETSDCYPWNPITLYTILDRQRRWPNRQRGYSGNFSYYDVSWTVTDKNRQQIEHWRTWMSLKYGISIESYTVVESEDQEINRV